MKRICLLLLLCISTFGASTYEKGKLISLDDASIERPIVSVTGSGAYTNSRTTTVRELRYRMNIQVADTVYVGLYTVDRYKPYYPSLEFNLNSDVDVRIEGRRIYLKRPNGQDVKLVIEKRLDRKGKARRSR